MGSSEYIRHPQITIIIISLTRDNPKRNYRDYFLQSSEFDAFQFSKRVILSSRGQSSSTQRTSWIMILPSINTDNMKVFFTSGAIFQFLIFFIHLCKANGAICIIFQINIFRFLSSFAGSIHPCLESFSQLTIQNPISSFGYLRYCASEIIQYLLILSNLSNNKVDMLTRLLFHFKIEASAGNGCRDIHVILGSFCLFRDYQYALNHKPPALLQTLSVQQKNLLIFTSFNPLNRLNALLNVFLRFLINSLSFFRFRSFWLRFRVFIAFFFGLLSCSSHIPPLKIDYIDHRISLLQQTGYKLLLVAIKEIMEEIERPKLPEKFWCYKKPFEVMEASRQLFKLLLVKYRVCCRCILRFYGFEQPRMYTDTEFFLEAIPILVGESLQGICLTQYDVIQCGLGKSCWCCEEMFQRSYLLRAVEEVQKQISQRGYSDWQQFKLNIRIPSLIVLKNLILAHYLYSCLARQTKDQKLVKLYYNILILPIETNKSLDHKNVLKWILAHEITKATDLSSTADESPNNIVISFELELINNDVEAPLMALFNSYLGLEKKKQKSKGRKICIELDQQKHATSVNYKCNANNITKISLLRQGQFQTIFTKFSSQQAFLQLMKGPDRHGLQENIQHKLTLLTKNVYLCGRYIKYSRYLSQTPWMVNGKKLTEGSLQQSIQDRIYHLLYPEKKKEEIEIKFHSGGRQDIDVRMLTGGRPFVLEFVSPIRSIAKLQQEQVTALMPVESRESLMMQFNQWVNQFSQGSEQLHSWRIAKLLELIINYDNPYVQVLDFQQTTQSYISVDLKAAESQKIKHYLCYIYADAPFTLSDKQLLDSLTNIRLQQMTPLRVLHRRTLMLREKIIHRLRLHTVSKCSAILEVWASAGTYIKEFVHGDLGRTTPNIGQLVGKRVDILQLDVGSLKEGEWKEGDETVMKLEKCPWMD